MYQIKYTAGYEIHVMSQLGWAKMGYEARVEEGHTTVFTGSLENCEKWLKDRRIKQHGHGQTAADIAAYGRGGNR